MFRHAPCPVLPASGVRRRSWPLPALAEVLIGVQSRSSGGCRIGRFRKRPVRSTARQPAPAGPSKATSRRSYGRRQIGGDNVIGSAPAEFDEEAYLKLNADVAAAVRSGQLASAWEHVVNFGYQEHRQGIPDGIIA